MQQIDIDVINDNMLQRNQEYQGIFYFLKTQRQQLRESFFTRRNNQNIFKYRSANYKYYQFAKFHQTKSNNITHYQLRKCLIYNEFTNLFIHISYNKLSFYNSCSYKQSIQTISQDFNIVGISQYKDLLILAGLQSNIQFFSLKTGETYEQKLNINQECIINQADLINNQEIIISDNDNQIRIFDVDNLNQQKYLALCSHCVNHCAIQQNLIIACLDQPLVYGYDRRQQKSIFSLQGHKCNNFAAQLDPINEMKVATSGEDKQCKIWDLRKIETPSDNVDAITSPFYNILYNNQGQLICIEGEEFIQIVDVQNTKIYQIIDFFEKCSGCTIYKDKMFFNLQSHQEMGLFEYNLINNNNKF